jgi:hypothetical protein
VKGWDDKCDGKLRLRTEVERHRRGKVTAPSTVAHKVRIDNVSVLDLHVSFTSTPADDMLVYPDGKPWTATFRLDAASKPRRDRSESNRRQLAVAALNGTGERELKREVTIESTAQYRNPDSAPDGPVEQSTSAYLRLTLQEK